MLSYFTSQLTSAAPASLAPSAAGSQPSGSEQCAPTPLPPTQAGSEPADACSSSDVDDEMEYWLRRRAPKPKSRFCRGLAAQGCTVREQEEQAAHCRHTEDAPAVHSRLQALPGQVLCGSGWLDSARGCVHSAPGSLAAGAGSAGQDSAVLWEGVGGDPSAVLCAVLDGHGPQGARVAGAAAAALPRAVARRLTTAKYQQGSDSYDCSMTPGSEGVRIGAWSRASSEVSSETDSPEAQSPCSLSAGCLPDLLAIHGAESEEDAPSELEARLAHQEEGPASFVYKCKSLIVDMQEDEAGSDVEDAIAPTLLEDAFAEVNETVCRDPSTFPLCSGTTATLALLSGRQLTVAHVGDSRCVLAVDGPHGAPEAIPLTVDHRASDPSEMRRIKEQGGEILALPHEPAIARVFPPGQHGAPGLAVSRSIGDELLKGCGVTCHPDIMRITLDSSARFLILGTSGLWNSLTAAAAVHIVSSCCDRVQAAERLTQVARQRWLEVQGPEGIEDVSAVVYYFSPCKVPSMERTQ